MRRVAIAALVGVVAACGYFKKDKASHATATPRDELNARADLYCALEAAGADAHGFVGTGCDLVLFNGLRAAGCLAQKVELTAAEDPDRPGEWNRDSARTCYPEGRTSSRFSRDMLRGLLVWAWRTGPAALPAVQRFVTYAEAHDWTICEATDAITQYSRCHVTDGLKSLTYDVLKRLGGDAPADELGKVGALDPTASDYPAHLAVLDIYLRGLLYGATTAPELEYLKLIAARNPGNALFAAIARKFQTSDQAAPIAAVVGDLARFPEAALPGSAGRCTDYVWQRADGADWQPCPATNDDGTPRAPETYTGVDLVFFRAVVDDALPVGGGTANLVQVDAEGNPRIYAYQRTL